MLEKLSIYLNRLYLKSLVRDDAALRFFLNNAADAESNGEATVFERVQPMLDGQIAKLVAFHAADEVRHAKILVDELVKLGGTPTKPPEELRMVEKMGKAAGDVFNRAHYGPVEIARAYFLLYAVERRAIERFTLMEEALREAGRDSIAEVFATIAKDERRHMLYCTAVTRAVIPDDAEWTKMRDDFIELEAEVFTENSRLFMFTLIDQVFTTMSTPQKLFWKTVRKLNDLTGVPQYVLDVGGAKELPNGRAPVPAKAFAA